ncbi:MAG: restriction endonuclease subunit S [bacterium]
MSAEVERVFAVWFDNLDRWVVRSSIIDAKALPTGWRIVRVGNLVRRFSDRIRVEPGARYKMLGVKWYGDGTFHRETVPGASLSAAYVTPVLPGAFIYNRLFAWKGAFAVVPPKHKECFVSGEFPQFTVDEEQILTEHLYLYFTCPATLKAVSTASVGSAAVSRNRFKEEAFLAFEIPVPPLATQRVILSEWRKARQAIAASENESAGSKLR